MKNEVLWHFKKIAYSKIWKSYKLNYPTNYCDNFDDNEKKK